MMTLFYFIMITLFYYIMTKNKIKKHKNKEKQFFRVALMFTNLSETSLRQQRLRARLVALHSRLGLLLRLWYLTYIWLRLPNSCTSWNRHICTSLLERRNAQDHMLENPSISHWFCFKSKAARLNKSTDHVSISINIICRLE